MQKIQPQINLDGASQLIYLFNANTLVVKLAAMRLNIINNQFQFLT